MNLFTQLRQTIAMSSVLMDLLELNERIVKERDSGQMAELIEQRERLYAELERVKNWNGEGLI